MAGAVDQNAGGFVLTLPAGACDCHTHVFGPAALFPYWEGRAYTPPYASVGEMTSLHRKLGIERVVIVQPSPYGTDNRATLDAASRLGGRARVIAVIDPGQIADVELETMARGAVRGVRLNFASGGVEDGAVARAALRATIARIRGLGWHVQLFTTLSVIEQIAPDIAACQVPVVVDHFGLVRASDGPEQQGFSTLLELLRASHVWVKMSAGYRVSDVSDWRDIDVFASAMIEANENRLVWGSDWPHPGHRPSGTPMGAHVPPIDVDDAMALKSLWRWCGEDGQLFRRVLVDNPGLLYGFVQSRTS